MNTKDKIVTVQDIINYLLELAEDSNESVLQGENFINFNNTMMDMIDHLEIPAFELPKREDGSTPHIISYCGSMKDIAIYKYVKSICENSIGSYGYISNSDAGKLLNMDDFVLPLQTILGDGKNLDDFVYTLNQKVSQRFMEVNASGDVIALANAYDLTWKVWYNTELQVLMNKTEVTSINGIDKSLLLEYYNAFIDYGFSAEEALMEVAAYIQMASDSVWSRIAVRVDESGNIESESAVFFTGGTEGCFVGLI